MAAWATATVPKRFTSTARRCSATGRASKSPVRRMPAQWTTPWSPPRSRAAPAIAGSTCSGRVTSTTAEAACSSLAARSRGSGPTSHRASRPPRAASPRAVASPMPLAPPVTRKPLPEKAFNFAP